MKRHEIWREAYRQNRYMSGAEISDIQRRFQDINNNIWDVDKFGHLLPKSVMETPWWPLVTHLMEELDLRGSHIFDLKHDIEGGILATKYSGSPRGELILGGKALPDGAYFARIGRRDHIVESFTKGIFRISPASTYDDPSLNSAIQDDELSVVKIRSAMVEGEQKIEPKGEMRTLKRLKDNFFVLCFAHSYDPRLLDDFGGDAVIIIHDIGVFVERISKAVAKSRPDLECVLSFVKYYDPYFVNLEGINVESMKHFRYSYQNEIRLIWSKTNLGMNIDPFFVDVGPLRDIAQLYVFPV